MLRQHRAVNSPLGSPLVGSPRGRMASSPLPPSSGLAGTPFFSGLEGSPGGAGAGYAAVLASPRVAGGPGSTPRSRHSGSPMPGMNLLLPGVGQSPMAQRSPMARCAALQDVTATAHSCVDCPAVNLQAVPACNKAVLCTSDRTHLHHHVMVACKKPYLHVVAKTMPAIRTAHCLQAERPGAQRRLQPPLPRRPAGRPDGHQPPPAPLLLERA